MKTASGGCVILGRSDATLNVNGVRIGTAEIHTVVESIDGIRECMAVARRWQRDSRIVLFVCLNDDAILDDALRAVIRERLRNDASPR